MYVLAFLKNFKMSIRNLEKSVLITVPKTCNAKDCSNYHVIALISHGSERLLLNHEKTQGFLASGREEFNPGPETRLDRSELLYNRVLLKYKRGRESF